MDNSNTRYIIYRHKFKNNKSYIGYTKKTLQERLNAHIYAASRGINNKFYRALRKYGHENIESTILYFTKSMEDALEKEIYYIKEYDAIKNGYNISSGGSGGWIIGNLSKNKQKDYWKKRSEITSGQNNPMYSGYSDDDIIKAGANLYLLNGNIFSISNWRRYCEGKEYPINFSKCRFSGEGFSGFKKGIAQFLGLDELNEYSKTSAHNKKLREAIKGRIWINNGEINKQVFPEDPKYINSQWKRGRILKNNYENS